MRNDWRLITDLGLGVLRARGADAITFLQGQLSNDAAQLHAGTLQLSGYHTPQGRAIALLRVLQLAPGEVLAVLPQELMTLVVTRLKRFVLRAKVQITDESAQWQLLGYAAAVANLPEGALCVPYGSTRQLVLIPTTGGLDVGPDLGTREDWIACDIKEGLPQVYLGTSEAFVAQMLNLDVTGGIAFDKGCYTGQEIIARAHYRGHVKRRMQRFVSEVPCQLTPGQSGVLADGRGFKVVAAVTVGAGRCEFLAVTNPAAGVDAESTAPAEDNAATQTLLAARQLPLPYELPLAS